MRIIAGTAKGRKLTSPKGFKVRPTSSRVKEALFNILKTRVEGSKALDLFAGAGTLGIEALSRGARGVTFVDNKEASVRAIEKNLKNTDFAQKATVLKKPVMEAITKLKAKNRKYNLIFIDPPYKISLINLTAILGMVVDNQLLEPEGVIVLEHSRRVSVNETPKGLKLKLSRNYGDTTLSFYYR